MDWGFGIYCRLCGGGFGWFVGLVITGGMFVCCCVTWFVVSWAI